LNPCSNRKQNNFRGRLLYQFLFFVLYKYSYLINNLTYVSHQKRRTLM
jgi:hypothetical protein